MTRTLLLLFLSLVISACGTSGDKAPVPRFYLLDDLPKPIENRADALIALNKIIVPDFLKQRNLVIRQQNQQISIANFHSWADDLPESIRRVVINDLNRNNRKYRITKYCSDCPVLSISIDHFYPTDDGSVMLAGSYVLDSNSSAESIRETFSFTGTLRSDGFTEAVFQMRQLLRLLSDDINLRALK